MILDQYGRPIEPKPKKMRVRASYDTTARTAENVRHWQHIDELSADESLEPQVRKDIRSQARYECQENNCYGKGIARTLVNDIVGTGPRLQMQFPDKEASKRVEQLFQWWADAVCLAQKVRTNSMAKMVDGEGIIRLINSVTTSHPVQLGLQLVECDQLQAPSQRESEVTPYYVDGVHLSTNGEPTGYDLLRFHPGARLDAYRPEEFDTYPVENIIHTFRMERPGQHRGVSELAPALPLFAFLRRFTLATISAAETSANVAQVVESDLPIPDELEEDWSVSSFDKWMENIPIDRNSATVLPNGWKLKQVEAEHPTTTYEMFKREVVNEIARVVLMPVNVAMANSKDFNFASGRLDHLIYRRSIEVEQSNIAKHVLDKIFSHWLLEASLMGGILPNEISRRVISVYEKYGLSGVAARTPHNWYWDGIPSADEKSKADAVTVNLKSGMTHRAREYTELGLDVDAEDEKAAESYGITVNEYRKTLFFSTFSNGNQLDEEKEEPATAPQESGQPESSGSDEDE